MIIKNFDLEPLAPCTKGDINSDGIVDIVDGIICAMCLSGLETIDLIRSDYSVSGCDVNGDNKIGIEEFIYILQEISEFR